MSNLKDMSLSELVEVWNAHRNRVVAFYDDPMTTAYGVPTGDFQADFDKQERAICSAICEKADKDSELWQEAWAVLQSFIDARMYGG